VSARGVRDDSGVDQPADTRTGWVHVAALSLLLFCSGLSALVYQVLWLRMLGWVFGVTVYAASTVWATFMTGLAVGSLAAAAVGDRTRHPLRWFGLAELAIGATALASATLLGALQRSYAAAYPSLVESFGALTAVRAAIAVAALIVPTALMGATLPLVVRASGLRRHGPPGQLGVLYGSNALGAIAGTVAAGLYFIPERGLNSTFLAAATLNTLVGMSAIGLTFLTPRFAARPPDLGMLAPATIVEDPAALGRRHRRLLLAVFTLSGTVSLALEVVWFRVLTLFIRPTAYGFATMLATVLAGIALGSYIVTPLLGRRLRWFTGLAFVQFATAVAIVLSFNPLSYLGATAKRLTPVVAGLMPEYLAYPLAGSLLAIFPAALLMGLAFPIGLHLWTTADVHRRAERTAGRVGLFYALNVVGGIAGSLLGGFVLLPLLGSGPSLVLLASMMFASGLALLSSAELRTTRRWLVGAAATAAFAASVGLAADPLKLFLADRYPGQRMLWSEEGVDATAAVHERGGELSLTVNGIHEASTGGTMTFVHRRIGHLPMALHPAASRALVIGLGGGATAGAVSTHTGVHVDIVELSGSVVRGARFFDAINHRVLDKPNVRVRVDDGRNYLMLTGERYDVVTADIILPIWAGAGNLYSVEYFRLMRRVLRPGALVLQWVAGTEQEYKLIARTFLEVFPHTTVWADGSLLVGSVEPLRLRRQDFEWKLGDRGRREALREAGYDSFEALLASFVAGPDELRAFVGAGPLLTDDRPLAEYFLSLPRDTAPDLARLTSDVRRLVVPD
jgi:spermidine synthase